MFNNHIPLNGKIFGTDSLFHNTYIKRGNIKTQVRTYTFIDDLLASSGIKGYYNTMDNGNKNPYFDDLYFSDDDGMDESFYVFIQGNHLEERLQDKKEICIGETGFGTGLNFLTLLDLIENLDTYKIKLCYRGIEKYPLPFSRIKELLMPFSQRLSSLMSLYEKCWTHFFSQLTPGWNRTEWDFPGAEVYFELFQGDAVEWSHLKAKPEVDAWFLDGHSPEKNPDIWTREIMKGIYERTVPGGTLASFTSAGMVKRALREAGFFVKRKKGFGKKRHMIQGQKT